MIPHDRLFRPVELNWPNFLDPPGRSPLRPPQSRGALRWCDHRVAPSVEASKHRKILWTISINGGTPKSSILDWDLSLNHPAIKGYPHDYGNLRTILWNIIDYHDGVSRQFQTTNPNYHLTTEPLVGRKDAKLLKVTRMWWLWQWLIWGFPAVHV